MSHRPYVEWVPLEQGDPFEFVPKQERSSVPGLEGVSPKLPDVFRIEAERAWGYVGRLDRDPHTAIREPNIRAFVEHIARSGFCGGVILRYRMKNFYEHAPDPATALPPWLQTTFLSQYGIVPSQELHEDEKNGITEAFHELVAGKQYYDAPHGRYFTISAEAAPSPRPRSFKCYVEGKALASAFQTGALQGAFAMLEYLPFGLTCKLFEQDRLVLYSDGDVKNYADIQDMFAMCGIHVRGPAQDVWSVNADKNMELKVDRSNDQSLGDGGGIPDALEYPLSVYEGKEFFKAYLRLCAYSGKSPSDPYLTNFVRVRCSKQSPQEQKRALQEAAYLTGYPGVLAELPRELVNL